MPSKVDRLALMRHPMHVKDRRDIGRGIANVRDENVRFALALKSPPKSLCTIRFEIVVFGQMNVDVQTMFCVGHDLLSAQGHRWPMKENDQTTFIEAIAIADPIGNVEAVILMRTERYFHLRGIQSLTVLIEERDPRGQGLSLRVVQPQR